MGEQLPTLRLDHLINMTGPRGLFEHAEHDHPRESHGYTTDDNARALVVLAGDLPPGEEVPDFDVYVDFVTAGRVPIGWHNRMSVDGDWLDRRGSDDAHGRALWGLGTILANGLGAPDAAAAFLAGLDLDTRYSRSNCYAILGATKAHAAGVLEIEVEGFLDRVSARLPREGSKGWAWPEPVLTYDNARLPQALILAGEEIGDTAMVDEGLSLLDWLIGIESGNRGFSFTPVGGRRPGESGPAFDQQPLEAWAMADACLAAAAVDHNDRWLGAADDAAFWFMGRNDARMNLYDAASGAGFDGLEKDGVNLNRGAESTLAALGTIQALSALVAVG